MINDFTKIIKYDIVVFKSFCYTDDIFKDKLIYDVKKLTFDNLYYQLMKDLIDNNYLEYESDIDTISNSYYFKVLNVGSNLTKYNSYVDNMFNFIILNNKILYIDADTIYYSGILNLDGIDIFLKYEIEDIYCLKFTRMKNISYIKNNNIIYNKRIIRESTLLELKSILRNKKIKELTKKGD